MTCSILDCNGIALRVVSGEGFCKKHQELAFTRLKKKQDKYTRPDDTGYDLDANGRTYDIEY